MVTQTVVDSLIDAIRSDDLKTVIAAVKHLDPLEIDTTDSNTGQTALQIAVLDPSPLKILFLQLLMLRGASSTCDGPDGSALDVAGQNENVDAVTWMRNWDQMKKEALDARHLLKLSNADIDKWIQNKQKEDEEAMALYQQELQEHERRTNSASEGESAAEAPSSQAIAVPTGPTSPPLVLRLSSLSPGTSVARLQDLLATVVSPANVLDVQLSMYTEKYQTSALAKLSSTVDSSNIIRQLNGIALDGSPIGVELARPTIVLGPVPLNMSSTDLKAIVSRAGVAAVDVQFPFRLKPEYTWQKATVLLSSYEQCDEAVVRLDGKRFFNPNKHATAYLAHEDTPLTQAPQQTAFRRPKIYVAPQPSSRPLSSKKVVVRLEKLSTAATQASLVDAVAAAFGRDTILDLKFMMHSRRYDRSALVTLNVGFPTNAVVQTLSSISFEGKLLYASIPQPHIVFRKLPLWVTKHMLFGLVASFKLSPCDGHPVPPRAHHQNTTWFIELKNLEECNTAVQLLNGKLLQGSHPAEITFAQVELPTENTPEPFFDPAPPHQLPTPSTPTRSGFAQAPSLQRVPMPAPRPIAPLRPQLNLNIPSHSPQMSFPLFGAPAVPAPPPAPHQLASQRQEESRPQLLIASLPPATRLSEAQLRQVINDSEADPQATGSISLFPSEAGERCALVEMASVPAATRVQRSFDGMNLDGFTLRVKLHRTEMEASPTKRPRLDTDTQSQHGGALPISDGASNGLGLWTG